MWGPSRLARVKEVIFRVLSPGYRTSPLMWTRYERQVSVAQVARIGQNLAIFANNERVGQIINNWCNRRHRCTRKTSTEKSRLRQSKNSGGGQTRARRMLSLIFFGKLIKDDDWAWALFIFILVFWFQMNQTKKNQPTINLFLHLCGGVPKPPSSPPENPPLQLRHTAWSRTSMAPGVCPIITSKKRLLRPIRLPCYRPRCMLSLPARGRIRCRPRCKKNRQIP